MKKYLLLLGFVAVIANSCFMVASADMDSDLSSAIKMYKSGNYTGCIQHLEVLLAKDPSDAIAHYYMAMANAQAGRVDEAISHYQVVIDLNSQKTLVKYARKGKLCLESPDKCNAVDALDSFINAKRGFDLTNKVKNSVETQNLDELRRDINSNKLIEPERLRQFKNYSSMGEQVPSNDEIVAAMRVLQRAGLSSIATVPSPLEIQSAFAGNSTMNMGSGSDNIMQLMNKFGASAGAGNMDPKILQTMLTSQMLGF